MYRSEKLFDLIGVHAADAPPSANWWRERIHPDDIARLQEKLPELLASANNLYEAEYRVRHEDGRWVDIWERGCLVRNQQGQVIRIVGSTVDISEQQAALRERKQVELNLREAHIQLEAALAAGSVYTWRWNITENRLIVNRSLAHLFGVDAESAAKGLPIEHFLNAIHPDDQAQVRVAIEEAIATGEEYVSEYRIRNTAGEERWVIARGRVEYDTNGNPLVFPGALADISARKQAELERQRSEALLRGFFAASPIALALFDRELRFLYANEALAQLNELPLSQHFGRTLWEVVPQMAPQFAPMLLQIMETQQPVLNLNFNGEVRPGVFRNTIANHYPVCLPNGEVIGVGVAVMDVSDLTQTQQQLRESEERFRTLADNISQLAWMTDETGYIVWYNQRWFDYTGTTLEEMQGWGWQKVHHPDYVESVTHKLRQHLETGEIWEDTFPLRGKDGRYRWFLSRAVPVRDEQGQILRWFGTNTDITERQEAQEKLRKSEAEFRTISNAAPALVWVCDAEGKNVLFNERWYEYTGQTAAEAYGYGWVEVIHPEDAASIIPYWQHCQKTGKIYEGEIRYLRHDGEYRWHAFRALPRRGATGEIEAWYGLSFDINDRKQAQAALQERSQHIQMLYETTRDLLSSSQPLTLAETIFNKLKEMMGVDVYLNYILDEQQQKLHLTFHGGIPQEVAQQLEWLELGEAICGTVAQQGRQIVWGDVQNSHDPKLQLARSLGVTACACQPLIVQGKVFGTLSFGSLNRTAFTPSEQSLFQAICDQMAIALERSQLLTSLQQQTEELMRVNRIKDEFLAVLSHELRSPLNPILGWTKLLQKQKLNPAKTTEALATIERNAKLQTQLIDDLLDIAKILRGKLTLQIAAVDLVFVMEAAIDTVTAAAIAKNIILHPVLPQIGQVAGDAVRLQQVVWNLLSNAIKFTPNYGRVDIQLQRVGNQAQITVSDTGKGINPSFLPHIFESFCQEDASTTRKFGGLGLGLAIVRQLVEAHGGSITADSPGEGLGATFTVQLPLVNLEPETPQPEAVFEPEPDLTGMRVLIVDDEPDARELIAVILNQYGAQTLTLTSAKEVLTTLESFQPNILVSDIGMPEVDGYSLMRQIRALPATKGGQIPAIALTAYAGEINHQQAISAGFQRHISKPVDFDILVRAIAELCC
ncbi:PAS domain-containing protein [Anabaena azotica]|uniref:histidine kinase n=1 Tax=Anabaena azotica FACHB-119 TaxID=947527 RepID=A0ABR8CXJ9_9NOST|nr:PAS domain-containing protein [Anabaena azotica]MBD2499650.1 PAS domain-containing protein [Anabaena azotica FACHB-119]